MKVDEIKCVFVCTCAYDARAFRVHSLNMYAIKMDILTGECLESRIAPNKYFNTH